MGIAPSPPSSLGRHPARSGAGQVGQKEIAVGHDRSRRNADDQVVPAPAGLIAALAVLPPAGSEVPSVAKCAQGREGKAYFEDDRAAVPSVAPVGAPVRNVLLPPEGNAAVSTGSRLDEHFRLVNEHDAGFSPPAGC